MTTNLKPIKTKNSIIYKYLVLNMVYQYGYAIIYYGFSLTRSFMKEHFVKTLADGQTENKQYLKEITTHSVLTSLITPQTITKSSGQEFSNTLSTEYWCLEILQCRRHHYPLSILKFNNLLQCERSFKNNLVA